MTAMSLPRIFCRERGSRPTRLTPSKTAVPEIWPPGVRPSRLWVSTVLPDPDSPTMPRVRPGSTLKETPRTACTTPSAVGKLTRRSVTSSRLIGFLSEDACEHGPPGSPDVLTRGVLQASSSLSRLRHRLTALIKYGQFRP